ncbi:MAG: MFS transporter [Thermodesulfobacteriota bacterium]
MAAQEPVRQAGWYRWLVFALLALAYLLVYFHRTSPAVVAKDMMADLGAGEALMGFLASAYFYPYAVMQLPAGLLADSWGPRRTITIFFVLAGAASIFFGLAESAAAAVVARVLVGLGLSMLFVSTMKTLTRWFRLSEFATMTGILIAVGGLGVLVAAGPLAYLSQALGWRGSFMAIGGVTLALAAAIWLLVRNTPQELGFAPVEDLPAGGAAPRVGLWRGVAMVLGAARFWPLAVWYFFTCGTFFSFVGLWGGPFLMDIYGMDKTAAGGVLNMAAVAMIVGSPALSWLSDRTLKSRKKVLVLASVAMVVLALPLCFYTDRMSVASLYVWCFLLSLFSSAIVTVGFTTAKELFPVGMAGTAVGLINLFPFLGGAVMQPLVGWLLQAQDKVDGRYTPETYATAFSLYLGAAVVALAASLFLKETVGYQPPSRG